MACVSSLGHCGQKDECVPFVFLFLSILRNEVVRECEVSWGKCKLGILFLSVTCGPEGVSCLDSTCC